MDPPSSLWPWIMYVLHFGECDLLLTGVYSYNTHETVMLSCMSFTVIIN